ncbi:MAG: hypothetical protein AAFR38_14860 [Planctomycetota bacterium]
MSRRAIGAAIAAGFGIGIVGTLAAGPITPPAGPVGPTGKTTDQIEPRTPLSQATTPGTINSVFRISSAGSYYLTDDVNGQEGKHGILIAASDVTLDLNGFTLNGSVFFGGPSLDGVHVDQPTFREGIAILNGGIRFFGGDGIAASGAEAMRLEGVRLIANGGNGAVLGPQSVVAGSSANENGADGFVSEGGTLRDCVAADNTVNGFRVDDGGALTGCVARGNGRDGFNLGNGATANACSAVDSGRYGLNGSGSVQFTSCSAVRSGLDGFFLIASSTAIGCTSRDNTGDGFILNTNSSAKGCYAGENGEVGFVVGANALALENVASFNGNVLTSTGAGFDIVGPDNRVEANSSINNGIGYRATGEDSLIIRNSARDNGVNWSIVAGNFVGRIVSAPESGQITGDTGGSGVGTTDPWANITFRGN